MSALAVASALALSLPRVWPLVVALDLLLFAACALDLLRTPRPERVRLERSLPERAGLARELERTIELDATRARGLAFALHEESPESFAVVARTLDGALVPVVAGSARDRGARDAADDRAHDGVGKGADEPGDDALDREGRAESVDVPAGPDTGRFDARGRARARRVYRGSRRGVFALGDVRLRITGPLGLLARQARLAGAQEIAIEPALPHLRRTLALAASERWHDLGLRRVARRGGETEFESLREYVRGDDVRRVDWKAWARRGKPIVRDYEVERGQELVLLVDRGRRMRATTAAGRHRGWTKLDWALDAALELAAVALAKGDRVGAGAFAHELDPFVQPARGPRQLARLTRALFALQPLAHEGDLGRALRELATRHRRRASVIVLSDVADPLSVDEQRRALAQASRRHRVVFAALDDPSLRALAEGTDGTGGNALERAGALELAHDRRSALRRLATSGARVLDTLPAEAAGPLLAAWLAERRR